MYLNRGMRPEVIASCIPSPHNGDHLNVRTVEKVIRFYMDFGHVCDVGFIPGRPLSMPPEHIELLRRIVPLNLTWAVYIPGRPIRYSADSIAPFTSYGPSRDSD